MTVVIVPTAELTAAWTWLSGSVPPRPAAGATCSYNDLASWTDGVERLLHEDPAVVDRILALYLASHMALLAQLLKLVNTDVSFDVTIQGPKLDGEVKKLYRSKPRFRASLGEHLAFWITAAQHRGLAAGPFAISDPHHLSEDKGPDGIVFRSHPTESCEIVSVKQSPSNISGLMSSARFRQGREPRRKKMLDDLFWFAKRGYGFARVEKLVADVMAHTQVTPDVTAARALLLASTYQGVALSSHDAGAVQLYDGFHRVAPASRCVATFIGSPDWESLADTTRARLVARMRALQVW